MPILSPITSSSYKEAEEGKHSVLEADTPPTKLKICLFVLVLYAHFHAVHVGTLHYPSHTVPGQASQRQVTRNQYIFLSPRKFSKDFKTIALPRPLISFRTTPCCELRKVKETSGGPEGDSKSVHTKGKGVGLSEI